MPKQIIFNIRGPYINGTEVIDKLAIQEAMTTRVLQKSHTSLLGHPAIRQEVISQNGIHSVDTISFYIGDVQEAIRFGNGSSKQVSATIVPGITITDHLAHEKATTIFNQILSTVKFTK